MKTKPQKTITIETHEVTIIRFKRGRSFIYCDECQRKTLHLSVVRAVSVLSLSEVEIFEMAQEKLIHSKQAEGRLLLCGDSLALLNQK